MVNIQVGMGEEIIQNMEAILSRPEQQLLCAKYCEGPGAVQAFYLDSRETVFMYYYKLREEVNDPKVDTACIIAFFESKLSLIDFYNFIINKNAPVYEMTDFAKQFLCDLDERYLK